MLYRSPTWQCKVRFQTAFHKMNFEFKLSKDTKFMIGKISDMKKSNNKVPNYTVKVLNKRNIRKIKKNTSVKHPESAVKET